ncbi:MAG: ATP-binding protein [Silanimonas sp.]
MKARTRVAAVILAFAALPLILVNASGYVDRRAHAARDADLLLAGNADELAALLAATRTRWLESVRADARLPGVDEMLVGDARVDPRRTNRFFTAIGSRDAVNINAIGLLDLEGRVVEDSSAVLRGRDESLQPWFLLALSTGQPQMIGPYTPEGDTAPGLYVSALVRDVTQERRGVLRLRMAPSMLGQVMTSALVASPGLSASLVDDNGRVLAGVGAIGESALALPATIDRAAPQVLDVDGQRVAIAPVANAPWHVAVRQPLEAWAAPQGALRREWLLETVLMLALLLAASMLLGYRIAAPLARFSDVARRMANGDLSPVPSYVGSDEARQLGVSLDGLATRMSATIGSLSRELEQRRDAEAALHASREQFLALVEQLPGAVYRCAHREGWPMDYLSPQIEQLTGFSADELLADDAQGYTRLMSAADVAANAAAVAEAVSGSGRFELRYRIRHRDGRLRWIWELGSVHRADDGSPGHLTGVLFDITDKETASQAMDLLRGRVDARVGGDFFLALAGGLVRVLDVDSVLIGRFRGNPPTRLCSLALSHRGGGSERVEFDLGGTPNLAVLADAQVDVLDGVQSRFPEDVELQRRGLRAYIGRRLDDRHGRPIGVLAVLHGGPMAEGSVAARLLDLFQARVAAELERVIAEEDLQRLADTLENRVGERTRELEAANASLSQAMEQLVQREKLASLGSLVAGIAHELNTPIGNALTVSTALNDIHHQFAGELAGGQLKRSTLDRFVTENHEATALIERNLQRAATLISHFKQVAVDQASVRRRRFDLAAMVVDVLSTLSPRLKRSRHRVEIDIPPGIVLESYPGPLEQVLTNLIENSLVHAFEADCSGVIRLSAMVVGDRIRMRFEDDGRGIAADVRHRVFDPFFTTRLGQGGSGLGLYLVYNLVHGPLGGSIELLESASPGACFIVELPAVAPAAVEEMSG